MPFSVFLPVDLEDPGSGRVGHWRVGHPQRWRAHMLHQLLAVGVIHALRRDYFVDHLRIPLAVHITSDAPQVDLQRASVPPELLT